MNQETKRMKALRVKRTRLCDLTAKDERRMKIGYICLFLLKWTAIGVIALLALPLALIIVTPFLLMGGVNNSVDHAVRNSQRRRRPYVYDPRDDYDY